MRESVIGVFERVSITGIPLSQKDFRLIIDNCTYFNDRATIYHKEALKLGKVGDRLIAAAADTIEPDGGCS